MIKFVLGIFTIAKINASLLDVSCDSCLVRGGTQCLGDNVYWGSAGSSCCQKGSKQAFCRFSQRRNQYCATKLTISNPFLQNWTCGASADHCPNTAEQVKISISDFNEYKREYTYDFKVPSPLFSTYHCKYKIQVAQDLLQSQQKTQGSIGYIRLEVEMYGFDESVTVMVQPRNQFVGIIQSQFVKVYPNVVFGTKLYLPANSDVLISFVPVKNLPDNPIKLSYMGRFRLRTWYQQFITQKEKYEENVIIYGETITKETIDDPVDNDETDKSQSDSKNKDNDSQNKDSDSNQGNKNQTWIGDKDPMNNNGTQKDTKSNTNNTMIVKPKGKVNWDGEVVAEEPWYDKELFKLNGSKITPINAAIFTGGTILIMAGIITACCSFIAYRKRKELAREIRRVSIYTGRISDRIRRSISGRTPLSQAPDDDINKKEKLRNPSGKKQKSFFREMQEMHRNSENVGPKDEKVDVLRDLEKSDTKDMMMNDSNTSSPDKYKHKQSVTHIKMEEGTVQKHNNGRPDGDIFKTEDVARKVTANFDSSGEEDMVLEEGYGTMKQPKKNVYFADKMVDEMSSRSPSGSIVERHVPFQGYRDFKSKSEVKLQNNGSLPKSDAPNPYTNKERGFTKVNNILKDLEDLSDLERDLDDPELMISEKHSEAYNSVHRPLSSRRGTTKSGMADKDAFLRLIKDSRTLIQDLNEIEEEMDDVQQKERQKSIKLQLITEEKESEKSYSPKESEFPNQYLVKDEMDGEMNDSLNYSESMDIQYQNFLARKSVLLKNVEEVTGMRYNVGDKNYDQTMAAIVQALEQEEAMFKQKRNSIVSTMKLNKKHKK